MNLFDFDKLHLSLLSKIVLRFTAFLQLISSYRLHVCIIDFFGILRLLLLRVRCFLSNVYFYVLHFLTITIFDDFCMHDTKSLSPKKRPAKLVRIIQLAAHPSFHTAALAYKRSFRSRYDYSYDDVRQGAADLYYFITYYEEY